MDEDMDFPEFLRKMTSGVEMIQEMMKVHAIEMIEYEMPIFGQTDEEAVWLSDQIDTIPGLQDEEFEVAEDLYEMQKLLGATHGVNIAMSTNTSMALLRADSPSKELVELLVSTVYNFGAAVHRASRFNADIAYQAATHGIDSMTLNVIMMAAFTKANDTMMEALSAPTKIVDRDEISVTLSGSVDDLVVAGERLQTMMDAYLDIYDAIWVPDYIMPDEITQTVIDNAGKDL